VAIKKQEFYEGAALHLLVRSGAVRSLRYDHPFFIFEERTWCYIKYSTKGRSPWGFTFMPDEQRLLRNTARTNHVVIALVCGSDGVAALPYEGYELIAPVADSSLHVGCFRRHGEHFQVNGPAGSLSRKIAPSSWLRIMDQRC
jgi:hypothetical protein